MPVFSQCGSSVKPNGWCVVLSVGGQVLVDGVDLTLLDATWYRSRVGVVSQEPRLFSLNVRDNITYGCPFR